MELLRPHQKVALTQLQNGNILWGPVGSGKSRVAVAYYEQEHRDRDVYVITTAKKRDGGDWKGEFANIAVGPDTSQRICTESEIDIVPDSAYGLLTVDSWNNIDKYSNVTGAFFIFDEQRLVGSGAWVKAFLKIARNNFWILLSATPGDTWLDYIPVFVANGFYKNRTQFKQEHVVYAPFTKFPKVSRYVNESRLLKNRERILVHMRYSSETIKHSMSFLVDHNQELFKSVIKNRWHIYQNRPIKDIAELYGVLRRVVNSDPSRFKKITELLELHPKMVIFYNFNYELDILRRLETVTNVAEWNGHKHEKIPDFQKWAYLVQYVAGSEGWNCVETDTIAFYSLTYSYKTWEQAHGRIDRLNTPFADLFYYTLKSNSGIDHAIWRSLKAKENFNAANYPLEKMKI
jgi:Type III restriction enzyme, res subunit